jgi:hypothetical protein
MRALASTILLVFCIVTVVQAVPPAPPELATLVNQSDLVVIVNVAEPMEKLVGKRKNQILRQRAEAIVERTLKGTAPERIVLTFEEPVHITCRPPGLVRGGFLLFLKKNGDGYVRANHWYSQAPITNNQVLWLLDASSDLGAAVAEIQNVAQRQE